MNYIQALKIFGYCHRYSYFLREMKNFLRKNLTNSENYEHNIWNKFSGNFWYWLDNVQDWSLHVKDLWWILQQYDFKATRKKLDFICFFQKELWLHIQGKIEILEKKYLNWDEFFKKVTATKVNAWHRRVLQVIKLDQNYLQNYCRNLHALKHYQRNTPSQKLFQILRQWEPQPMGLSSQQRTQIQRPEQKKQSRDEKLWPLQR